MNWLESQQVYPLLLAQIDPAETTFSLLPPWRLAERPPLSECFPKIITPILAQHCTGGIRIVSGFRRFQSARLWGLEQIPALLASSDWPELDLMRIAIAENRAQREFSKSEMVTIVGKLNGQWNLSSDSIREEFLPLIGLPPHKHHVRQLLRLFRMPEQLQRRLGKIEDEILLGLTARSISEQTFLLERLEVMRLGRNKQMQLFQLIEELCDLRGRSESSLMKVWEEAGCSRIANADRLSPADRYQSIWQNLRALRYPRLTRLEAREAELTRALGLPHAVQMRLPRFYEGERIEFRCSALGPEEVVRFARALLDAGKKIEMAELFELL